MKLKLKAGFTLVEVLISLTVFSVGIMGVYVIGSQAKILSRTSGVRTKAALLAQEGLELAVAEGYTALPTDAPYLDEASLSDIGPTFAPFSRTVTAQYVDANMNVVGTDTGMKVITATVQWTREAPDPNGLSREFKVSTIITNL